MCLKPYDYESMLDMFKTLTEQFMETLFNCKDKMGDGMYMNGCDRLKHNYDFIMKGLENKIKDIHSKDDYEFKMILTDEYWKADYFHFIHNLEYNICDAKAGYFRIGCENYIRTTDDRIYNDDYEYLGMYIDETGEIICY